jgi:hypothetical protein
MQFKKAIATAFAAAIALSVASAPASATIYCPPKVVPTPNAPGTGFPFIVGCIMGSAGGLILASIVKGGGLKWMSQKEWEDLKVKVPNPLTTEEALLIAGTCGLAAFLVKPAKAAPAVVKAKG